MGGPAAPTGLRAAQDGRGALPIKPKQLIAVAVAHTTQCPYCIAGRTEVARRRGATDEEIMEAIWVAAEMRAGATFAHSAIALHTLDAHNETPAARPARP